MIRGMTGFGNAAVVFGKTRGVVEIKSQNHRYFDLSYYLPIGFAGVENKIRLLVNKEISRGRLSVTFKITEKPLQKIALNKDAVNKYLQYAQILKKEFELDNNLTLADLIRLPGVVDSREENLEAEEIWPALEKGLARALKSLLGMRIREGRSLAVDMSGVLKKMQFQLKQIQLRTAVILKEKKTALSTEEFLPFQKSNDVNEEIARLNHYIQEFRLLLKSAAGVGKKLDFVAQEMQREANTIGSKVQDKIVANAVIAIKGKIEKLREQSQNVE